jgi:hypothetical protein
MIAAGARIVAALAAGDSCQQEDIDIVDRSTEQMLRAAGIANIGGVSNQSAA